MSGPIPTVAVAGHICLDVIPRLAEPVALQPGHLYEAGPAALSTGGAVANVGVALHRLGVPVRLLGKVGDDLFGSAVRAVLDAQDPGLADGLIVAPGEATSYSIVVSPPGVDRAFLHCPGANDTFTAADVPPDALAGSRVLHFGYPPLMRQMYADGGKQLGRLLAGARSRGVVTSLDMCDPDPASPAGRVDWPALLARVLPDVDLFAPSIDELRFMFGAAGTTARELATRALELGAGAVALKLGERGLYLRTGPDAGARLGVAGWDGREVLAPCFAPERVAGTTGSGDCTIAGLLAALVRGADAVAAATTATAVGACSVETAEATTGVRPWTEVGARVAAGWARLPHDDDGRAWQRTPDGTLFDPEQETA